MSAHLHRLTLAFVTVPESHVLPQMAMCVLFTPAVKTGESTHLCRYSHWTMRLVSRSHVLAAKALATLLICTGPHGPRHGSEIACAGSNGDFVYHLCEQRMLWRVCTSNRGTSVQTSVDCINV